MPLVGAQLMGSIRQKFILERIHVFHLLMAIS